MAGTAAPAAVAASSHKAGPSKGKSSASKRLRRGTRTEDYLIALSTPQDDSDILDISDLHSPFEVQEYLTLLVAQDPHNVQRLVELPKFKRDDRTAAAGPSQSTEIDPDDFEEQQHVERDVWLFEHLRRLANDLSHPFVLTLQEHCSRETCPEMKAGEWLYLCAAHATANETECCAIDYITHTLDGAIALLNSSRYFPSRLSIPSTSLKHFTSIARRLYRIFAHAWFHHREVFDICESETSLYERFLALSQEYDLVSPDLLVIPSQKALHEQDAGGSSSSSDSSEDEGDAQETMLEESEEPGEEAQPEEEETKEDESEAEATEVDAPDDDTSAAPPAEKKVEDSPAKADA